MTAATHSRMRGGARRWLRVPAVVAAVVLAASCASIPNSGPVVPLEGVGSAQEGQSVRVLARPPRPGASAVEVVEGFLAASASAENDHAVAREYLTPEAAGTWTPSAGVIVYDSAAETAVELMGEGANAVRFRAERLVGRIGQRGDFSPVDGEQAFQRRFILQRIDNQWRIENPPEGVLLSSGDVERSFRSVNAYFPDRSGEVLVPDTLFLPALRPTARTQLVQALVQGPTDWLAPAVGNAFPEGTRLEGEVLMLAESGVAAVELSLDALRADPLQRGTMLAQLTYTLDQLPEVTAVRVTAGGLPLTAPGADEITRRSDWESYDPAVEPLDPSAYAVVRGRLEILADEQRPVGGWLGGTSTLRTAAVSLDGAQQAGVVDEGGEDVLRAATTASQAGVVVHRGSDLGELSWDRLRRLWFVEHAGPGSAGTVRMATGVSGSQEVRVDGLDGRAIRGLRVSRDGARIALVVTEPGQRLGDAGGELLVGRVRTTDGSAVLVDGLRRIENQLVSVQDVAWADGHTLAVVGAAEGGAAQVYLIGLGGGSAVSVGTVPGLRAVAAAPGSPRLAGTVGGEVWVDGGNGWRRNRGQGDPFYPG